MANHSKGIGHPASGGIGFGPAYCALDEPETPLDTLFALDQKTRLSQAIAIARQGLVDLAGRHEETSADILEFQIEILDDPSLLAALDQMMETGLSSVAAWNVAYAELFQSFINSDDPVLRARAVDVLDLKNRGLRAFGGVAQQDFPPGSIFVGEDMEPSAFLVHDWSQGGGILLQQGSDASHVAILARARSVPMIVKAGSVSLQTGDHLKIDGQSGAFHTVDLENSIATKNAASAQTKPSGLVHRRRLPEFKLFANISDPEEIHPNMLTGLDGIGLVRTEFLIRNDLDLYDSLRQEQVYQRLIEIAAGKPVTFRLFDFGFDKPLPGNPNRKDASPLGMRGVRLLLRHPDILNCQIRAILLASRHGACNILVPMVTVPSEIQAIRSLVLAAWNSLLAIHPHLPRPMIGMMVEVPAAALTLDAFAEAEFFSFGTNDLAQYLLAADRHDSAVADIYRQSGSAVLRLLKHSLHIAKDLGKPITICGDMAADAASLPELITLGFSDFSVALDRVAPVDALLGGFNGMNSGT